MYIHDSLDHRTFRSQDNDFIIGIIKRRTDSPRITNTEHLAAACDTTNNETTIPRRYTPFQYIAQINPGFNGMRNIHTPQSFSLALLIQMFHDPVQPVSYLFEHNISIRKFTRMLTNCSNIFKDLIYIRQVKITTKGQILNTPVITA